MVTLWSHIDVKIEVVDSCPNMLLVQGEVVLFRDIQRRVFKHLTHRVDINAPLSQGTSKGRMQAVQVDAQWYADLPCRLTDLSSDNDLSSGTVNIRPIQSNNCISSDACQGCNLDKTLEHRIAVSATFPCCQYRKVVHRIVAAAPSILAMTSVTQF